MNKKKWIILIVIFIFGAILFLVNYDSNKQNQDNNSYETNKTSTQSNINTDNNYNETQNINKQEGKSNQESTTSKQPQISSHEPIEEQIASFSTKIYSNDPARQNNITITCNALNNTIVKNGTIFSFCNIVGPSTTDKGYQKADIFDNNGKKKKGLGGGNCQISTTLYNAILSIPNIQVTERHAHSNNVPYIQKGKDAAVAYGSYDLKFVNNTGNDIKINSTTSTKEITVNIIALK